MAKIALGKTPQVLEEERLKKEKELNLEIQQSILDRQRKIAQLHSKQKTNKLIIISII